MRLTRKILLDPSYETQQKLWFVSNLCTFLWNCCKEQRDDRKSWRKVNKYTQSSELKAIKESFPDYKIPSSQVIQNTIFSLDNAYQNFFVKLKNGDKTVKRPKFKSRKYFFTQEYSQPKTSFAIENGILKLSYGKSKKDWLSIPIKDSRPLPQTQFKTCTVSYDKKEKKWYASITYVFEEVRYQENNKSVYFDPGSKTTLTGISSAGEFFEYDIQPLRKLNLSTYHFIDKLISQRDKMNKKQRPQAYMRLCKRIKKLFRKINTRTKMYLHELANQILKEHPDVNQFFVGDWSKLSTKANTENRFLNRKINRAVQNLFPLEKLIGYLSYKAKMLGKKVEKFNERGTTRTCTKCGKQHRDGVSPSQRVFRCVDETCDFTYSRDHHSCLNFLKKYEPALWRCLVEQDNLPTRSKHMTLSPFACKTQRYSYQL